MINQIPNHAVLRTVWRQFFLSLCLLAALMPSSYGQVDTITTEFSSNFSNGHVDKNGAALPTDFSFEMGVFANGFVPRLDNMSQWASNWKKLVLMTEGNGWVAADPELFVNFELTVGDGVTTDAGLFYSSGSGADTDYGFSVSDQVYLWAFNDKDLMATTTEWALLTGTSGGSPWIIPDAFDMDADGFLSLTLDGVDTAVIGMFTDTLPSDTNYYNAGIGPDLVGDPWPSIFKTDENTYGGGKGIATFDAYSVHQYMQSIPEPSRMLFLVMGLVGMTLRRQRLRV